MKISRKKLCSEYFALVLAQRLEQRSPRRLHVRGRYFFALQVRRRRAPAAEGGVRRVHDGGEVTGSGGARGRLRPRLDLRQRRFHRVQAAARQNSLVLVRSAALQPRVSALHHVALEQY